MKKLLSFLAAVGLTATSSTTVIACNTNNNELTKVEAKPGETYAIGQIDNVFPETILKGAVNRFTNFDENDYQVHSYGQSSAQLILKKSATTLTTFNPITVTYSIKAVDFNENNTSLKLNILAGAMNEFGIIDLTKTIAKVMTDKLITQDSIRTSFAQMNGIFLNEGDIEIGLVNYETKTVVITSKNQNILKGDKMTLTLNTGVSSQDLLRITELGTVYLPGNLWEKRDQFYNPGVTDGAQTTLLVTYPIVFQNLGDKNNLFSYLASDLVNSAGFILKEIEFKQAENMGDGWLNFNLSWGGMSNSMVATNIISADSQTTKITFKLAQEERVIMGNYTPEELVVSESTYSTLDPELVKNEIYNQLNDEFKTLIPLEIFKKFTTIHFETTPTIEVLPGGDWIFGFNKDALLLGILIFQIDLGVYNPPVVGSVPGYGFSVAE